MRMLRLGLVLVLGDRAKFRDGIVLGLVMSGALLGAISIRVQLAINSHRSCRSHTNYRVA